MTRGIEMQMSKGGEWAMAVFGGVSSRPTAKGPLAGRTYPELRQFPTPDLYVLMVIK